MIRLRSVEKYFEQGPARSYVLRRVDLDIAEGEFVSIIGPSGAGKSTLLHIIGMHDMSWTGEYHFYEHAVHKLSKTVPKWIRNTSASCSKAIIFLIPSPFMKTWTSPWGTEISASRNAMPWCATCWINSILLAKRIFFLINSQAGSNNWLALPVP